MLDAASHHDVASGAPAWRGSAGLRRSMIAAALGLLLSGCQTSTEEVLDVTPSLPPPAQETLGAGQTMIAMLLPRSGAPSDAARARDFVDGARMAVGELGGGQLRVTVYDTQTGAPADLAKQAVAGGARLVVAAVPSDAMAAIANAAPTPRPPLISLNPGSNIPGAFAFASDAVDSAVEAVRASNQAQVIAVVPQGFPEGERLRLERGIARNKGRLLTSVAVPQTEQGIEQALRAQQAAFKTATTVVVFGGGNMPALVAQAIVKAGLGGGISALVGNSSWSREVYAAPVLDGALVALPDQDSLKQIAMRYQKSVGRPLSFDAALAYDAVAVAAGIVRLNGANGLTGAALLADTGFRGATGVFRLHKDGSVERRHTIYRIERGKPVILPGQKDGF